MHNIHSTKIFKQLSKSLFMANLIPYKYGIISHKLFGHFSSPLSLAVVPQTHKLTLALHLKPVSLVLVQETHQANTSLNNAKYPERQQLVDYLISYELVDAVFQKIIVPGASFCSGKVA